MEIGHGVKYTSTGNIATSQYAVGDFTTNGAHHLLDLSPHIGKGEKLVYMHLYVIDNLVNSNIGFYCPSDTNYVNGSGGTCYIANVGITFDFWVKCSVDGKIDYVATNTTWTTISLTIRGWLD